MMEIMKIRKVPTLKISKQEWELIRSKTIGGSDASSILGINPYKSAYALWAEKSGRITPDDISGKESVRIGNDLEEYVARRFTEKTGKKVRRENFTIFRDDMPFAHANYDRIIVGEKAGLECKTTNALQLSKFKNGEFPANYYCQCVHYLMVSGLERWYLAVLVLGIEFKVFCIERDEAEIEALRNAEYQFWQLVKTETPPEIDGSLSTEEALNMEFSKKTLDNVEIDLTCCATDLSILDECTNQIRLLEDRKAAAQCRIMKNMGSSEHGAYGQYKVTWKNQTRSTFDRKKFEKDHGQIPKDYFKISESRTFRFKKGEI